MKTTHRLLFTLTCGWLAATSAVAEPLSATPEDPDEAEARLRDADALPCPLAPGGRVWLEQIDACGASACEALTRAHVGAWTFEDSGLQVRCTPERVELIAPAWELALAPTATGRLRVDDEAAVELARRASTEPLDEAARRHLARLYEGLRVADGAPPYAPRTLRAGLALLRAELAVGQWAQARALREDLEAQVPASDIDARGELSALTPPALTETSESQL
ncbi:hypothetical protein KRR26_12925 [Corallococcus sp. M34]|uniref:hypothetical protein n=1 Tax=Citreicoccus inhibens TaxID=2849499 RepID=UPI001C22D816|nr:hypothetical protein [Citreicoccus inhibens]MBU8896518.1 hypothetical protein [Citreicoccus inhibens]